MMLPVEGSLIKVKSVWAPVNTAMSVPAPPSKVSLPDAVNPKVARKVSLPASAEMKLLFTSPSRLSAKLLPTIFSKLLSVSLPILVPLAVLVRKLTDTPALLFAKLTVSIPASPPRISLPPLP